MPFGWVVVWGKPDKVGRQVVDISSPLPFGWVVVPETDDNSKETESTAVTNAFRLSRCSGGIRRACSRLYRAVTNAFRLSRCSGEAEFVADYDAETVTNAFRLSRCSGESRGAKAVGDAASHQCLSAESLFRR